MKYAISKQHYYYSGAKVVEIAIGGIDYAGSDAIEIIQEETSPKEAVECAINVLDVWIKEKPKDYPSLVIGCTYGLLTEMSVDELDLSEYPQIIEEQKEAARKWAEKELESLPKCDRCGEVRDEKNYYILYEFGDEVKFCSEYCADEYYYESMEE